MREKNWWWQEQQLDQTIAGTFEGGGLTGHAFTGALEAVVESGNWFYAVAGASSGAATAALIAAGLPLDTGRTFLEKIAPTHLSANWWQVITKLGTTGGIFRQHRIMIEYECLLQQSIRGHAPCADDYLPEYNLIFGDHPINGYKPVTFKEMFEATNIELHITVTNLSHVRSMIFNHKTAPDISVTEVVFASTALPIAFVPPLVTHDCAPDRMETVVDGGVWANMPRFVYESAYRQFIQLPTLPENVKTIGFLLSDVEAESDDELSAWLKEASFSRTPKKPKHWRIFPRHSQSSLRGWSTFAYYIVLITTLLSIPALSIPLAALYEIILDWLGNGRTLIPLIATATSLITGVLAFRRGCHKQTIGAWGYVLSASFIMFIFSLSILFVDSHFLIHQFIEESDILTTGLLTAIVVFALLILVAQFTALIQRDKWKRKRVVLARFALSIVTLSLALFIGGYLITELFNDDLWERIVSILLIIAFFVTMFYSYLVIFSAAPIRYLVLSIRNMLGISGNPNRATKKEPNIIPLPIPAHLGTISITIRGMGFNVSECNIKRMVDCGRAVTRTRLKEIFNRPTRDKEDRKVGVFGSGGLRGVAYIGAIEEMEQHDIRFDAVAGVGAGALMAAFVAARCRSDELKNLLDHFICRVRKHPRKITSMWFISYLLGNGNWSIVDTDELIEAVNRKLAEKIGEDGDTAVTFSKLYAHTGIELNILAIDLTNHEPLVFNHIATPKCQVADAILASQAYPLFISLPFLTTDLPQADIPHRLLFDGSIADTLPTFIFDQFDQPYNNRIYAFSLDGHKVIHETQLNDIKFHYILDPDPQKGQYPYEWGEYKTDEHKIQKLRGRWPDPEQWSDSEKPPPVAARLFDAAAIVSKLFQQIFHPVLLVIFAIITVIIGTTLINICLPHDMVIVNAIFDTNWQITRVMLLPFFLLFFATAAIIAIAFTTLFTLAKLFSIMLFSFLHTFGYGARIQWWEMANTPNKTIFALQADNVSSFGFDEIDAKEIQTTIASGRASVQSQSPNIT